MRHLKFVLTTLFVVLGAEIRGETMPPESGPVDIVVLLAAEASQAARGKSSSNEAKKAADAIVGKATRLGTALRPQHPDTDDPELSGYFVLVAPSAEDAENIIKMLLDMEGVEAAYLKPQPALP